MITSIPGFILIKKLYENPKSVIFLATKESDQKKIVIKALKSQDPKHAAFLKHEYSILHRINHQPYSPEVFQLNLQIFPYFISMEYYEGSNLESQLSETETFNLISTLRIGMALADALGFIHSKGIIHKDINPQNILVNPSQTNIKIIDFGNSTLLNNEYQEVIYPEALEGSIAYISPEQTGRMNRTIDYRTDIYSAGVLLYEMLTGQPPFKSEDLMDLVYMHLANPVTPINEMKQEIPQTVSAIVLKCLEKEPEKRYFSAYGLKNDLSECLSQLYEQKTIHNFLPGYRDSYERFQIPQKLYGREYEIGVLLEEFEKIVHQTSILFVSGFAGIGKSSLVLELQKPIAKKKGYFIKGKFEQFKKDVPLNGFIQAFQNLVHQLLTENIRQLEFWKFQILKMIGDNGQILIEMIPELEQIIGPQPLVSKVEFYESENRFYHVFLNFIKVFLTPDHPLVLFLDDLQWADYSSLKLLFVLSTEPNFKNLYIIGAFRSNEIENNQLFFETINKINKEGKEIETLEIGPLSYDAINEFIEDLLHTRDNSTQELTKVIYDKTRGNPFFLNHFLNDLYNQKLLTFNSYSQKWNYELPIIDALNVDDNVSILIEKEMLKSSLQTQETLKIASAIGNIFDINTLSLVTEMDTENLAKCLWEALQSEFIMALQPTYSLEIICSAQSIPDQDVLRYKFQHDRVQQAAYNLIPENQKDDLHLKIGKILLTQLDQKQKEENLIQIVNQLNKGNINKLTDEEKIHFAELNQQAGQKAIKSIAYPAAEKYFSQGIKLLPDDKWKRFYDLTLALHKNLIIAMNLSGDSRGSIKKIDELLEFISSPEEKVALCLMKMEPVLGILGLKASLECGKEALKYCDVTTFEMSQIRLIWEALKIKFKLKQIKWENIEKLPESTNQKAILLSNIYSKMSIRALFIQSQDFAYIVINVMNLTLKYGLNPSFPVALVGYALSMTKWPFFEFKKSYELGKIASNLANKNLSNQTCMLAAIFFLSRLGRYGKPYKELITEIKELAEKGDSLGHLWTITGPINYVVGMFKFLAGDNLDESLQEVEDGILKQFKTKFSTSIYGSLHVRQLLRVLKGLGEDYDEPSFYQWSSNPQLLENITLQEKNVPTFVFYNLIWAIVIDFFKEKYEKSVGSYQKLITEYSRSHFPGDLHWSIAYFFGGLSLANILRHGPNKKYFKELKYIDRFLKACSTGCAANFLHQSLIISSEIAFLKNNISEASKLCLQAVDEARKSGNLCSEAIAFELLANYSKFLQQDDFQKKYLLKAYDAYEQWSGNLKLKQLEKNFPEILKDTSAIKKTSTVESVTLDTSSHTLSTISYNANLNPQTIIHASQMLSEEIILDKLIAKIMRFVMIEAGAEKSFLILNEDKGLFVAAEAAQKQDNIKYYKKYPIEKLHDKLSLSIVQFVSHSQKQILLKDASKEITFNQDPYISSHQPHSIFCLPLIYQGKLTGILYMENSLIKGAFSNIRSALLTLLSSQIAISLENALQYSILENKVADRTNELNEKNSQLTLSLDELKNTQAQLIESEKLAALSQLIAGIAHEVNTPLGAVRASAENASSAFKSIVQDFPELADELNDESTELFFKLLELSKESRKREKSSKEEREIKKHIIEELKKSNIDRPLEVADLIIDIGIYEDIIPLLIPFKNQIVPILNRVYQFNSLYKNNKNILSAVEQAGKIIYSLKTYAHDENEEELTNTNIIECIENTLLLYQRQLYRTIQVIKNYKDDSDVLCRVNDINQVWINLIYNSIQSIGEKNGIIEITVYKHNSSIVVEISDNGPGIPLEIQDRIFTPFFSTKPQGEGSGLGLSISKRIVEALSGKISFNSTPEKTTFTVELPITTNIIALKQT